MKNLEKHLKGLDKVDSTSEILYSKIRFDVNKRDHNFLLSQKLVKNEKNFVNEMNKHILCNLFIYFNSKKSYLQRIRKLEYIHFPLTYSCNQMSLS